jgi:enoyl-CoA hydratase/carnithine racemase
MRYVEAQHRGSALWITFDRPEKLNVMHPEDLRELRDVIASLIPGVHAVVFTGAGQAAFSAGLNIAAFVGLTPARARALIDDLAQVMRAIRHSPVVTVAAVSGYCLGAAFELALACDLRVVTTTASFGLPEIKVGVPSVIDAALLPAFVGLSKAREMVLTGDIYKLDQLPPDSIANVVAEPAELAATTDRLLDRIATHPRAVTASQRRLFDLWLNSPLDTAVNASMTEFAGVFESQETHAQIARHHKKITG